MTATCYPVDLVFIESEDGIRLEGTVTRPRSGTRPRPVPVIFVHGLGGRFDVPVLVRVGRELAQRGFTFIAGNNRGHHLGANHVRADGSAVLGGSLWDLYSESPRDIAAWVDFAGTLGHQRVALYGLSGGALKIVYYQAERQDPRVAGLITSSPPIRVVPMFRRPELIALAQRMVAEGCGRDLLPWNSVEVGAGTFSAQTYLDMGACFDVFGLDTPDPPAGKVRCPLLAFYGTNEPRVGSAPELELIRRNASSAPRVDTRLFEGADHSYSGYEADVAAAIAEWIDSLGVD